MTLCIYQGTPTTINFNALTGYVLQKCLWGGCRGGEGHGKESKEYEDGSTHIL